MLFSARLLSSRRRQLGFLANVVNKLGQTLCQALSLVLFTRTAACPANTAVLVDEVCVSDLAVQQTNRFANIVGDAAAYEEVLVPVSLGEALAERAHEEADEPRFACIILVVDIHMLCRSRVARKDFVQRRVSLFRSKRRYLGLGPLAAEDGDDGSAAGQEGRRVAGLLVVFEDGLAVEVREEERYFCLEESRRRNEGFTLVVLQVAPITEVRARKLGCPAHAVVSTVFGYVSRRVRTAPFVARDVYRSRKSLSCAARACAYQHPCSRRAAAVAACQLVEAAAGA